MSKKLIITICGRAGSKGFKNKNLKTFCGKPLVYYTLSAIELFLKQQTDTTADIVLNTDSVALKDLVLKAYPEVVFLPRPEALAGDAVAKMEVFQHSLHELEKQRGYAYDCHMDLDITSPMRRAQDVAGVYNAFISRSDLDVVMSAAHSRRSPYMNMAKRVDDHVEQVIKTAFVARQQTPPCYDINASIYAFRPEFLQTNTTGFLWDGKCDIYEMEDTAVLDIDSEEDFALLEVIASHLYATRADYAEVRDNIRDV